MFLRPMAVLLALALAGPLRAADTGVGALSWLSGCWAVDQGEAGSSEYWTQAAGGTLFGISRTVRQGRTLGYEFMQVRLGSQGRLEFLAQPGGAASPTVFTVESLEPRRVVFANAGHDFPQKVIYERPEAQRLIGRIEGQREGVFKAFDYPMHRVDCEPDRPR